MSPGYWFWVSQETRVYKNSTRHIKKVTKRNRRTVFSCVSTGSGVINFIFYHLLSILILLPSQFSAQLPSFASPTATNRAWPPPKLGWASYFIQLCLPPITDEENLMTNRTPVSANLSVLPLRFHRHKHFLPTAALKTNLLPPYLCDYLLPAKALNIMTANLGMAS